MKLLDIIKNANERIVFIGILPIADDLEKITQEIADLFTALPDLQMTILCESNSLCFQYSLLTDTRESTNRKSYTKLVTHRDRIFGGNASRGFFTNVAKLAKVDDIIDRTYIKQQNAILPYSAIIVDRKIYCTLISGNFPTLNDYDELEIDSSFYEHVINYYNFFINGEGSKYLSSPGDELLQLYDRKNMPRGIFPRSCFYTTKFKRRSMWGFVFNRKGELLLHQRSQTTKDGRGLWDKSVGGHIDLGEDAITTAKRELIEELFMKEAEFTAYIDAKIVDILSFGEWNLNKRYEQSFKGDFDLLDNDDWILFTATDENTEGKPLIIDRVSQRRYNWNKPGEKEEVEFLPTNFVSDVYLFIAPEGCIDTDEQLKERFEEAEKKGAAQAHKIIKIDELRDWIEDEIKSDRAKETFTDDLIYVNNEYMGMLEQFSEFVKYLF